MSSPSIRSVRAVLLAAIGGPLVAAGCSGKSDEPNDQTDLTDTVVPDTDTGGTDTGNSTPIPCPDGVPIVDSAGEPSGYIQCADGAVLRVDTHLWSEEGLCSTDADCDSGQVCVGDEVAGMGGAASYCITANCETGADCDSGECGLSSYDDGCGTIAQLSCRTDSDECRGDVDCTDLEPQCVVSYWSEEVWVCAGFDCAIGRPLVDDHNGEGRRAITAGLAISGAAARPIAGLDHSTRAALASWWARVAQMEHASVASFARVTLELMSLGAPSELLHGVQLAADDEIRHATESFALASRFAGVELRPGPLPTMGVLPRQGFEAVLRGLIHEACVGETIGVIEARATLADCTDIPSRRALTRIVEDETRHAALAWRTLAWLLDTDPSLVSVAEEAFAVAVAEVLSATPPELPDAPEWGLLCAERRLALREDAVMEVVLPCARTALSRARSRQDGKAPVTDGGLSPVA